MWAILGGWGETLGDELPILEPSKHRLEGAPRGCGPRPGLRVSSGADLGSRPPCSAPGQKPPPGPAWWPLGLWDTGGDAAA